MVNIITIWGVVADSSWQVVLHLPPVEKLSWAWYAAVNGSGTDTQESHVGVNATRFGFLERVLDSLDHPLNETIGFGIVGGGCDMAEPPQCSKVSVG